MSRGSLTFWLEPQSGRSTLIDSFDRKTASQTAMPMKPQSGRTTQYNCSVR